MFDVTKRDSFLIVEKWFLELQNYVENIKVILVGNKCDKANHEVTQEEAKELAKKYDAKYLTASALTDKNINEIFSTLAIGKNIINN